MAWVSDPLIRAHTWVAQAIHLFHKPSSSGRHETDFPALKAASIIRLQIASKLSQSLDAEAAVSAAWRSHFAALDI